MLADYVARLEKVGLKPSKARGEASLTEGIYEIQGDAQTLRAFAAEPDYEMNNLLPLLADPVLAEKLTIFILAENSD